jgi:ubiquinone/menaquinone biosynthesis C-methylase UbiE
MASITSKLNTSFWNEYFRLYDILNKVYPYQDLLKSVMTEMDLKKGSVVLDAGAGTGNLAVMIAQTGAEVVGLDSSEVGLEIFKKKLPASKAILHDLKHPIPFPNSGFDYICSINTLFAIDSVHREKICREFYRLLKPGGKLIMTNLSEGYRPIRIYIAHIREEIGRFGFQKAIMDLARIVGPTIKMFYYNRKMIKEDDSSSGLNFFASGEQEFLLKNSGFLNVSKEQRLFAGQAVLNSGFKV